MSRREKRRPRILPSLKKQNPIGVTILEQTEFCSSHSHNSANLLLKKRKGKIKGSRFGQNSDILGKQIFHKLEREIDENKNRH